MSSVVKFLPGFGGAPRYESKGTPPLETKDAATRRASAGRGFVYGNQPYTPPGANIDRMIRDGYEKVIWVFKGVDATAEKLSSWPIACMEGFEPDWKEVDDEDALGLLNQYSNVIERQAKAFRYRLYSQFMLSKKGVFVEAIPNRMGSKVAALNLLPPAYTSPIPDPDTFISGFKVEIPGEDRERKPLPVYDPKTKRGVLWLRKPHPTDPYSSITPLEAAGISIDLDFYARLYNRNFLMNDGRAGQLVAVKGGLSPEDAQELKARFSPGMQGAGRTTVIEADSVSVQDTAISPRDAQYAELRNITKQDILIALGTPESLWNAAGRTFDNADAEKENWLDVTVLPLGGAALAGLDPLTSGGWDDERRFVHDVSNEPVLRRRAERKIDIARKDQEAGRITIDEFRTIAELETVDRPGSRVLWINGGKVAIGKPEDESEAQKLKPVGAPEQGMVPGQEGDAGLAGFDSELDGLLAGGQASLAEERTTAQPQANPTTMGLGLGLADSKEWVDESGEGLETKAFNPKQPRYPMNHPMGGQFMDTGDVARWLAGKPLKNGTPASAVADPNVGSTAAASSQAGGGGGAARFLSHPDPKVRAAAQVISFPSGYSYPRVLGAPPAVAHAGGRSKATKLVSLRKGDIVTYQGQGFGQQEWAVASAKRAKGGNIELELVNDDGDVVSVSAGGQQTLYSVARTPHPTVVAQAKRDVTAAARALGGTPVAQAAPAPQAAAPWTPPPLPGQPGAPTSTPPLGAAPAPAVARVAAQPAPVAVPPTPAPAAAAPQGNYPPVPAGAIVYAHPQGKRIYVMPGGVLEVWKPNGTRGTTSATAAKLAAGYGAWQRVNAPATGPINPARAAAPAAPAAPAAAPTPQLTAGDVVGDVGPFSGVPKAGTVLTHSIGATLTINADGTGLHATSGGNVVTLSARDVRLQMTSAAGSQWTVSRVPGTPVRTPPKKSAAGARAASAALRGQSPTPAAAPPAAPAPVQAPATHPPATSAIAAKVLADGVPRQSVGAGWKVSGGQGGSNPARQMTDPTGAKFYVKSQDDAHADNEVAAARIYAAAGVKVPQVSRATIAAGSFPGQTHNGGIASRVVGATPDMSTRMSSNRSYRDKVLEDFAVHAWLGNWDAVENNNTMTDANGDPVTIDVGGSLMFRARGGARKLDDRVGELQSMRNASAGASARATFAQLTPDHTDARFVAGVERIAAISPAQIKDLVDSSMPSISAAKRKALVDQLVKRRAHLAGEARVTLPENRRQAVAPAPAAAVPTPTPAPPAAPAAAPAARAAAPAAPAAPVAGPMPAKVADAMTKLAGATPDSILTPPAGYPYPIVPGAPVATTLAGPKPTKVASLRKGDVIQYSGGQHTVISVNRSSNDIIAQNSAGQQVTFRGTNHPTGSVVAVARTPHPQKIAAARIVQAWQAQAGAPGAAAPAGPVQGPAAGPSSVVTTTPSHGPGGQAAAAARAIGTAAPTGYEPVPGQTYASPRSGSLVVVHSDGTGTAYTGGGAQRPLTPIEVALELDPGTAYVPIGPRILGGPYSRQVGRWSNAQGDIVDVKADGSGRYYSAAAGTTVDITDATVDQTLTRATFGYDGPSPAGLRTPSGPTAPTTAASAPARAAAAGAPAPLRPAPVPGAQAPPFVSLVGMPATMVTNRQAGQVYTNAKTGSTMTIDANGQGTLVLGPRARGGTNGLKTVNMTERTLKSAGWTATSGPDVDQPGQMHGAAVKRAMRGATLPPPGTPVAGVMGAGPPPFPPAAVGAATSTSLTSIARGQTVRVGGEDWIVTENITAGGSRELWGYRPGVDDPSVVQQAVAGGPWLQGQRIPTTGRKAAVIGPVAVPATNVPTNGAARPHNPAGSNVSTVSVGSTHGTPFDVQVQEVEADTLKAGDVIVMNGREAEGTFVVTRVDNDRKGRPSVFGYAGTTADATGTPGVEDKLFLVSAGGVKRSTRVQVDGAIPAVPVVPRPRPPVSPSSIERNDISDATSQAKALQIASRRGGARAPGTASVGDVRAGHIFDMRGYNAHPDVVSDAELDQYIKDGEIEIFRGISGNTVGNDFAEQYRSGPHMPGGVGGAMFGTGSYAAYGRSSGSQMHSSANGLEFAKSYARGHGGIVLRMTLKADARVADFNSLEKALQDDRSPFATALKANGFDVGVYAAYLGYDAIKVHGAYRHAGYHSHTKINGKSPDDWTGGFMVVLNRSAVRVSETNYQMGGGGPKGKAGKSRPANTLSLQMPRGAKHQGDSHVRLIGEP